MMHADPVELRNIAAGNKRRVIVCTRPRSVAVKACVRKVQRRRGGLAGRHEGCKIHIFTTKNAHSAHLAENYSGIGKLAAEQFGHERRKPKKSTEHE